MHLAEVFEIPNDGRLDTATEKPILESFFFEERFKFLKLFFGKLYKTFGLTNPTYE